MAQKRVVYLWTHFFCTINYIYCGELLQNINTSLAQRTRDFSDVADETIGSRQFLYRRSIYSQLHLSGLDTRRVFTLDNLPRGCAGHVAHDCTRYMRHGRASSKLHEGSFWSIPAYSRPATLPRRDAPALTLCRRERSRKNNTVSNWQSMCSI